MRNTIFIAAIAAVLLSFPLPAAAQSIPFQYRGGQQFAQSGSLTTNATDRVPVAASGAFWSTAQFKVLTAGTATATAQYSKDGGTNWIPAPYATKISAVNANPTQQAISSTTLVAGDIWEVPLPANATHFALVCGGTGTTTTVSVYPGLPYIPGVVVTAVLYDQTSTVAGALDTGTLDFTGWSYMLSSLTGTGGTPAFTWKEVDSTGAGWFSIGTAAASTRVAWSSAATGASASVPSLPDRLDITAGAVALVTNRIRVIVRR